jgi:dihydroneopterin aldolase / 2-amino-4-hydroxy-6-hydroxymethyldihydropteridine diphosphokinase
MRRRPKPLVGGKKPVPGPADPVDPIDPVVPIDPVDPVDPEPGFKEPEGFHSPSGQPETVT